MNFSVKGFMFETLDFYYENGNKTWGKEMITRINDVKAAEPLFEGWEETLIWSCLQQIMGEIYGDDQKSPKSAMAILGDFCFLAGEPNEELVLYKPDQCRQDFIIMIPQNEGFEKMIEQCYKEKAKRVSRYAIKKEPDVFNKEKLQAIVAALPKEYSLKMIDEKLFYRCKETDWCRDFVSQYRDYERYQKHGLGCVVMKDGKLVAGASSYSGYLSGIEIEIDTKEEYRRKGLATVCGAKLILECLKRKWYPSWDAQNKWSVSLAEKLGYHYSHEYTAYEIMGY